MRTPIYLGHALHDAGYLWYEEPIREFSVTAYKWLAERVRVPLLVGETSDGAHMNTGDFIAVGRRHLRAHQRRAARRHHRRDADRPPGRQLPATRGGARPRVYSQHLCMAIPNTTYYESLVDLDARRARAGRRLPRARPRAHRAGFGLPPGPDYPPELAHLVIDPAVAEVS